MIFREVFDGWKNDMISEDKLADSIKELSAYRLEICRGCEFDSKNAPAKNKSVLSKIRADEHCLKCGCPLMKKSKSPKSKCPIDKWGAMITEEEQIKITKIIDNI